MVERTSHLMARKHILRTTPYRSTLRRLHRLHRARATVGRRRFAADHAGSPRFRLNGRNVDLCGNRCSHNCLRLAGSAAVRSTLGRRCPFDARRPRRLLLAAPWLATLLPLLGGDGPPPISIRLRGPLWLDALFESDFERSIARAITMPSFMRSNSASLDSAPSRSGARLGVAALRPILRKFSRSEPPRRS